MLSMTTIEKPTVPTPLEVKEQLAKQGMKTAMLGEVFTDEDGDSRLAPLDKENYTAVHVFEDDTPPSTEVRNWEEKMALDETELDAKNSLRPIDSDEDAHESTLDGFTVVDTTRNEEVDELPEDLKDELGNPDESQEQ